MARRRRSARTEISLPATLRGALVGVLALAATITVAAPASACSCARRPVAGAVRDADAVYIARARLPDVWPGASFRVTRVLKGPARANVRARVRRGAGASCGTRVGRGELVLTVGPEGRTTQLSLCNENMRGAAAVREAQRVLGAGTAAPWRPEPVWLGQWALLAAIATWLWLRRRRRGPRSMSGFY